MKRCSIALQAIRERHKTTGGALAGPLRRLTGRVGADLSRKASASCVAGSRAFCMCMPQARLRATFARRSLGYVLSLKPIACGHLGTCRPPRQQILSMQTLQLRLRATCRCRSLGCVRLVDAAASVACDVSMPQLRLRAFFCTVVSLMTSLVTSRLVLEEDRIVLLDCCRSTAVLFCTKTLVLHHLCVRHAAPQFCLFCVRQHRPS